MQTKLLRQNKDESGASWEAPLFCESVKRNIAFLVTFFDGIVCKKQEAVISLPWKKR